MFACIFRYEIVNISMAPPEGANEEESSQAYYVIKVRAHGTIRKGIFVFLCGQAAQEKEELQRAGDELDAKNRKAEQELLALQNTLRVINSGNNQTKQSFKKLPESSIDSRCLPRTSSTFTVDVGEEMSRMEELEEQSRHLTDKVRTKRKKVEDIVNDLKVRAPHESVF